MKSIAIIFLILSNTFLLHCKEEKVSNDSTQNITLKSSEQLNGFAANKVLIGVTILSPGNFNIIAGYQFKKLVIRAETGINNTLSELFFQTNVGFILADKKNYNSHISAGLGYSRVKDNSTIVYSPGFNGAVGDGTIGWSYVGLFLDVNIYGIFVETGVGLGSGNNSLGSGNSSSLNLLVQVGYIFSF